MCGNTTTTKVPTLFKVGDKVRPSAEYLAGDRERWVGGTVVRVGEYGTQWPYRVQATDISEPHGLFAENELEPYTEPLRAVPVKPEYAAPLQEFKPGDRVRGRTDLDMSTRYDALKDGTVFEIIEFVAIPSNLNPDSKGYYVVREAGTERDVVNLNDYLFELVQAKQHPPVKYEDLLASNHANRRKRKQLKLQAAQLDLLRRQLAHSEEVQRRLYNDLLNTRRELLVARAAHLFGVQARVPGETQRPPEPTPFERVVAAIADAAANQVVASAVAQTRQDVYAGHAAQGGLQNHSVGDEYPYVVVGFQDGPTEEVYYRILDSETGNYYAQHFATSAEASELVMKVWKKVDAVAAGRGLPRTTIKKNGYFEG